MDDVPERRVADRRKNAHEGLRALVEKAAYESGRQAAQYVAARNRRRLVQQCFVAALVAALIVAIPVALITNADRANTARANSTFNCQQGQSYVAVFDRFLRSDSKLRASQRALGHRASVRQGFAKIILPAELRRIQARSDAHDIHATRYWRLKLLPQLRELAKVNCEAAIK